MHVNIRVLKDSAFVELLRQSLLAANPLASSDEIQPFISQLDVIADDGFPTYFWNAFDNMRRLKLGLTSFSRSNPVDASLWSSLEVLLYKSKADYTMFFREIAAAADASSQEKAFEVISKTFLEDIDSALKSEWMKWLSIYINRIIAEGQQSDVRRRSQDGVNPKYVLRNWMSVKAYESAEKGDFGLVDELHELLCDPYEARGAASNTAELQDKWYRTTPQWARNLPGCSFFSCSS
jgi:uncharacterized protein YdiU (UPF0061 family)